MTKFKSNLNDLLKSAPEAIALRDFILDVYPKRNRPFTTSWSTYAICATDEEVLLSNLYSVITTDKYPSYINTLPSIVTMLGQTVLTNEVLNPSSDDFSENERVQTAFATFVADAMRDIVACHLIEDSIDLVDLE
jgi:hypothetical protein